MKLHHNSSILQRNGVASVSGETVYTCSACKRVIALDSLKDFLQVAWNHQQNLCDNQEPLQVAFRKKAAEVYGFEPGYVSGYQARLLPAHVVVFDRLSGALWLGKTFPLADRFAVLVLRSGAEEAKVWTCARNQQAKTWGRYVAESFDEQSLASAVGSEFMRTFRP